ncbi:MAG: mannonate dehydratase [Chloroflexi bacterium]|nr:mannonate dehydratase [Chloroflexota bacterium]
MRIGVVLPEITESYLKLARQIGCTDIVTTLRGPAGGEPVWGFRDLLIQRQRIEEAGLTWSVIESLPMPDCIKLGLDGRDEAIERYIASVRNIGAAGIPIMCYNWMAVLPWLRTSYTTRVRGDALATSYKHALMERAPLTWAGQVQEEQLWSALAYFLQAVVPVAQEAGVRLAIHPDDPPVSPIAGIGRILTHPDAFQRVIDLVPSPSSGITFCQGCFAEMGADIPATIERFGRQDRMFFAHFRNVRGTARDFSEAFHDDGDTDMFAAMQAYYRIGFQGPMRPDHVPALEGEPNDRPGYSLWGRFYAIGYMRGLMEAVEKTGY